ncbi:unnamed protein product [Calicophoron daubneyi]|uniref:MARVEL domain-containing protein n=1 Tax=Calicophoron daubneyi TaxID=300641 RepID=A0AAV2T935_CALDB
MKMFTHIRTTVITLLIAASLLAVGALITSSWDCGNLFTGCQEKGYNHTAASVAALLILAALCFLVVVFMDFLALCVKPLLLRVSFKVFHLLFLLGGATAAIFAVILYTLKLGQHWSYFLAVCVSVFGLQAGILGCISLFLSSASKSSEVKVQSLPKEDAVEDAVGSTE